MFFDYIKTDLEEKLKLEREQCEQLKYNLEIQSQKQDEIKERSVQEANTKLTTLQQHYKLLKNQFEDFKEECSRIKSSQIDKINSLQTSLNSFKEPNTCGEKDKEIKSWKVFIKRTTYYNYCIYDLDCIFHTLDEVL